MAQHKGKKGKRPDNRPARARYWGSKALERNKSKRVAKNKGITLEAATKEWRLARGKRRMKGYS